MKITLILPTYAPKDYLYECLNSIKGQNFPHDEFELLIILNGGREPYFDDISHFISNSFDNTYNISLFYTDIGSVGNARNIGLENSKGEYITFIDDDDYVSANYLKGLYSVSKRDVVGLAHPKAFDSNGWRNYSIEDTYNNIKNLGVIPFYQARKFFQGPCMKLFHRDVIAKRRFNTELKNGEDALFMFLVSDKFKYVTVTPDDSIYYRRVRVDGAAYSKKSFFKKIINSLRLIKAYNIIYTKHFYRYKLVFFLTRILGAIKMCLN